MAEGEPEAEAMIDDPKARREALKEVAEEVACYAVELRRAGLSADEIRSILFGYSTTLCQAKDLLPNPSEPRPW